MFSAIKLTKHIGVGQYKYFGYGIEFDRKGFSHTLLGELSKNVIIFGVDMSSTTKIGNRKKDILFFNKGLEHTLSAEKIYPIYFTKENTTFCISLQYNGANWSNNLLHYNATLCKAFVNGKEIHKFTAKDSEITPYELCLGNISKDWTIDNIKKTSLPVYVYNFSVDYDAITVSDILDIHKYLMKKNGIV